MTPRPGSLQLRRRALVAELVRLDRVAEEPSPEDEDEGPEPWEQILDLRQEYAALVPVVALSRCPFTGSVLELPFDADDLDSPFWDHDAPIRPAAATLPSFFALTGAVRLGERVASAPFLCKPGPEVPYVLPRLLEDDPIGAVISEIAIGPHRGFPIAYFARRPTHGVTRANTWGTDSYWFLDEQNRTRWSSLPEEEDDNDFDLAPWIAEGSLWWIAPGDADLALHQTVDDCPYLDLPGRRSSASIRDGRVWWDEL